ncbi:hypothetical protein [Corynebacterium auris]|uniref:hypothetical protein n=1 Tax=Corynebacterium auris TaxID=44750 RepID=UPI0025B3BC19|nr:hypothetical protein [Corynebacterium auris]
MGTAALSSTTASHHPPAHASHSWSGARVARTLKTTEFIDRIGMPLNPIVLMHFLPAMFGVVIACEVLVWGFVVRRAAPQLAADIPTVTGFDGADGTYFLFAFASIPALIDVLAHVTRLATSARLEPGPFVQALPTLSVSTRDALTAFIAVPLVCRWAIFWSPLIVVAVFTANSSVWRLSAAVLCFSIALYGASAYRRLILFVWLPVPAPMNWFVAVLIVILSAAAGVAAGSSVASIGAVLHVAGGAPTELSVPLAPVLFFVTRPAVAWTLALLALAAGVIFLLFTRRLILTAPRLYSHRVPRVKALVSLRAPGATAGQLDRLLFPVVGEQWVRIMWTRPSTIATCFALSAAAGLTLTSTGPLPEALSVFVVVPALTAPLAEHFRSVDPRENLLRYRFHAEMSCTAETWIVLRLFMAIALGLLPLLVSSALWLVASDTSPAIAFGPLFAFVSVRSFFAFSPAGKGALLTLMLLCELGTSYALGFITLWSAVAGWSVLVCVFTTATFVTRSRLRTVKL